MKQLICPLDNRPCERDCPDRYKDRPEGGNVGAVFLPGGNADGR